MVHGMLKSPRSSASRTCWKSTLWEDDPQEGAMPSNAPQSFRRERQEKPFNGGGVLLVALHWEDTQRVLRGSCWPLGAAGQQAWQKPSADEVVHRQSRAPEKPRTIGAWQRALQKLLAPWDCLEKLHAADAVHTLRTRPGEATHRAGARCWRTPLPHRSPAGGAHFLLLCPSCTPYSFVCSTLNHLTREKYSQVSGSPRRGLGA